MSDYNANISIWDGNAGPVSGSTCYGFYDNDTEFITEAQNFARWAAKRLGYPVVEIELQSGSFYACFEEAVNEYGAQVNQFNIRDNMLNAQGTSTNVDLTQKNIRSSLHQVVQLAKSYGQEAGVGGNITWRTGSIAVKAGTQDYDLRSWADSNVGEPIEIKRIFHYAPPAVNRFYDPFVETGLAQTNLLDNFGWLGFSTAIQYFLFPLYEDLLRIQAIEFHDKIRRSGYSFELINNRLRIFPIPVNDTTLWFQYIKQSERALNTGSNAHDGTLQDGVPVSYTHLTLPTK